MGIDSGHNPKLPPQATPKVGVEKHPILQNYVKLMENEEKHMPLSHFVDRQKLPPLSTPKVGGEKKSTLQKHVEWMRNEDKRLLFKPFS